MKPSQSSCILGVVLIFIAHSAVSAPAAPTALDYNNAGLQLYKDKNYTLAEKYFGASLKFDPQNWKAAQLMGMSQELQGRHQDALRSFELSLQINPGNSELAKYAESFRAILSPEHQYVWNPAVEPYPRFTGTPKPLPKPILPFIPSVYLTAAYSTGVNEFNFGGYSSSVRDNFTFDRIPLRLHFQINSMSSFALGTEIWPALKNIDNAPPYVYSFPGYSYSRTEVHTIEYDVTPVSLGFYIHNWGKVLSFDCGVNITNLFYKVEYLTSQSTTATGSYPYTSESIYQSTTNGWGLGGGLEMNLNFKLTNNIGLFITAEGQAAPSIDYQWGLASTTGVITNNSTNPTSTYSSTQTGTGKSNSLGMIGGSIGFGLEAGF